VFDPRIREPLIEGVEVMAEAKAVVLYSPWLPVLSTTRREPRNCASSMAAVTAAIPSGVGR